jgi:dTDP-4-amino-4,6-dideoxygalactose transaminase
MIPILDLKAQYESIKGEINDAIAEVLESTQFIRSAEPFTSTRLSTSGRLRTGSRRSLGPAVRDLEQRVAAYCGCKYGVGVASGTEVLRNNALISIHAGCSVCVWLAEGPGCSPRPLPIPAVCSMSRGVPCMASIP